jgi:uncharacterized protein with HEPN domain
MPDRPGDRLRLQHMLEAIREIQEYTHGVDVQTFVNNSMMYNASLRQLEIIGEAANHLSLEILQDFPEVPWARIIGLRNLVIHEYFGVDDLSIWSVISHNLPDLKEKIALILESRFS